MQLFCANGTSLKCTVGLSVFLDFCGEITFFACLVISGLKDIFHWLAHLVTLMRSLFIISEESKGLWTVEKII